MKMNPELRFFYEQKRCCQQEEEFLEKAVENLQDPFRSCHYHLSGECRTDHFCRQLVKKVAVGSTFKNMLELKKWLRPGTAVYVRHREGWLIVTADPFSYLGKCFEEKDGIVLISKRNKYCMNCRHKKVPEGTNVCETCKPLFFPAQKAKIAEAV